MAESSHITIRFQSSFAEQAISTQPFINVNHKKYTRFVSSWVRNVVMTVETQKYTRSDLLFNRWDIAQVKKQNNQYTVINEWKIMNILIKSHILMI